MRHGNHTDAISGANKIKAIDSLCYGRLAVNKIIDNKVAAYLREGVRVAASTQLSLTHKEMAVK